MDLVRANQVLVDTTAKYNALRYNSIKIPVPYFINTAEHIYKIAMRESGIDENAIKSTIQYIKEGKSALGSSGGKGTPEQLEEDIIRLMAYLKSIGFNPDRAETIRKWMVHMHMGLDCSGYVYNILLSIDRKLNEHTIDKLNWVDPTTKKPTHAGVFIFDTDKFATIPVSDGLRPLDLVMTSTHTHIGIICFYQDSLCLVDCSMGNNGITFSPIKIDNSKVNVEGYEWWNRHFAAGDVLIKRITS